MEIVQTGMDTWPWCMGMFGARFAVFVRRVHVLPGPCHATRNLSFLRFHQRRGQFSHGSNRIRAQRYCSRCTLTHVQVFKYTVWNILATMYWTLTCIGQEVVLFVVHFFKFPTFIYIYLPYSTTGTKTTKQANLSTLEPNL